MKKVKISITDENGILLDTAEIELLPSEIVLVTRLEAALVAAIDSMNLVRIQTVLRDN